MQAHAGCAEKICDFSESPKPKRVDQGKTHTNASFSSSESQISQSLSSCSADYVRIDTSEPASAAQGGNLRTRTYFPKTSGVVLRSV